jgi:hypothetical protein
LASSKWTNRTFCSFPWPKSLNSFISVDICSLLFALQKSVRSGAYINKHWVDLRRSVRHLEIFSVSISHRSECDVQYSAQGGEIGLLFLVLRCRFTVCKFGRVFSSFRTAWKVMIT